MIRERQNKGKITVVEKHRTREWTNNMKKMRRRWDELEKEHNAIILAIRNLITPDRDELDCD